MRLIKSFFNLNYKMKIGTHNGTFHTDESMGSMLLTNFTHKYKNAEIIRTRDQKVLDSLDLILDVGAVYDHSNCRYDHHQSSFNETFSENHSIKLSASGLIWKHYGEEIIDNSIKHLYENDKDFVEKYRVTITDNLLTKFKLDMYSELFEGLDGLDNGVLQYPKDTKELYKTYTTELGCRVASLNANWFTHKENEDQDKNFKKAMELCRSDYLSNLKKLYFNYLSLPLVKKAVEKRFEICECGSIVYLDEGCNWKKAIFDVEAELKIEGQIKYIIYKDYMNGYRIQCVPISPGSFESRLPLREDWRGKRGDELKKISVDDVIFVHASGFIGGAMSLEGCIKLAKLTLNN